MGVDPLKGSSERFLSLTQWGLRLPRSSTKQMWKPHVCGREDLWCSLAGRRWNDTKFKILLVTQQLRYLCPLGNATFLGPEVCSNESRLTVDSACQSNLLQKPTPVVYCDLLSFCNHTVHVFCLWKEKSCKWYLQSWPKFKARGVTVARILHDAWDQPAFTQDRCRSCACRLSSVYVFFQFCVWGTVNVSHSTQRTAAERIRLANPEIPSQTKKARTPGLLFVFFCFSETCLSTNREQKLISWLLFDFSVFASTACNYI